MEHETKGLTRRHFHSATIGSLAAMIAGALRPERAEAQAPIVMRQLTGPFAVAYLRTMQSQYPALQDFINFFSPLGFNFIFDRAKVFAFFPLADGVGIQPRAALNMLGILPSFLSFSPQDPSHRAAAIIVHQTGNILAGSVTVIHNPFAIQDFSVYEMIANVGISSRTITAAQVDALAVDQAAALLGAPAVNPSQWDPQFGTLAQGDRDTAASQVFTQLINDSFAAPLYPPGAISALLSQTPTVEKFADINYFRYAAALGKASMCTSTSSSCNACSSCSTSTFTVSKLAFLSGDP